MNGAVRVRWRLTGSTMADASRRKDSHMIGEFWSPATTSPLEALIAYTVAFGHAPASDARVARVLRATCGFTMVETLGRVGDCWPTAP